MKQWDKSRILKQLTLISIYNNKNNTLNSGNQNAFAGSRESVCVLTAFKLHLKQKSELCRPYKETHGLFVHAASLVMRPAAN